ncbi:hypothetical protein APHAL10511_005283 [Amanita phalloides]|nr:hypothetical protein APHAL10511_005283 [Amanita phalloides]
MVLKGRFDAGLVYVGKGTFKLRPAELKGSAIVRFEKSVQKSNCLAIRVLKIVEPIGQERVATTGYHFVKRLRANWCYDRLQDTHSAIDLPSICMQRGARRSVSHSSSANGWPNTLRPCLSYARGRRIELGHYSPSSVYNIGRASSSFDGRRPPATTTTLAHCTRSSSILAQPFYPLDRSLKLAGVLSHTSVPTTVAVVHFPNVHRATEPVIEAMNQGLGIQCLELPDDKFMHASNLYGQSKRKSSASSRSTDGGRARGSSGSCTPGGEEGDCAGWHVYGRAWCWDPLVLFNPGKLYPDDDDEHSV